MLRLTRVTQTKILLLVGFGLVVIRLFYWQIVKASELLPSALSQYRSMTKIYPTRGLLYSADGPALVLNQDIYSLYWQKSTTSEKVESSNLDQLVAVLSENVNFLATQSAERQEWIEKEKDRLKTLIQTDKSYIVLVNLLTKKQADQIVQLDIPSIGLSAESARYYPESSLSAQVLGFVGKNENGEPNGYFGLEGYYDSELKGKTGFFKREHDALLKPIFTGLNLTLPKDDGRHLQLFLDRSIQFIAETELQKALERYGAIAGTVIVSDPNNGAVLAMASLPAYNPDKYWQYADNQLFRNPAVADTYEPGSTFKTIIMATAIDTKAVNQQTICDICTGPYKLDKYTINTWNNKYFPNSTMTDVIVHSDNVGMVFVSQKLQDNEFINYLERFGFGQKTGIDLQDEVAAGLRDSWSYVDRATASFGQGIAVTPIQMVQAVSAIANGGSLIRPRLVQAFIDQESVSENKISLTKSIIDPKTAATITEMMVQAVEKGESQWLKPKDIKVAGKTGTAQIPIAGHYDQDKTITSFIGFAPAHHPQYIILTLLREPTSSPWGSETAAPLFFNILKRIMVYKGI
jgi:cell division protein FtsI/penicillin-binding protein 2